MYKVLIVEDEQIIRKGLMYEMDWMQAGCVVVGTASNGEEGLEQIKELEPDIVITDIRMPFKDGLSMIEEAQGFHSFESILLTGYSEFEYAKSAISLGVTEYILKPVDFSSLREALEKLQQKKSEHLSKQGNPFNEWIDQKTEPHFSAYTLKVMEYIQSYYGRKITLSEMSDICGISSVHLNAKLKEDTHQTFQEVLTRYRIAKAVELISSGDLLIYEVAEAVGFSDYKYFSHVFKKYVGHSPSTFMK